MRYYIIPLFIFLSLPVAAQIKVDDGVRKPQTMMVSGNSVIDTEEEFDDSIDVEHSDDIPEPDVVINDEAHEISNPEKVRAPDAPVNPFLPAPNTPTKPNVRQVLKKMPNAKSQRSIADDRIDDGYVQQLMKDRFSIDPID